jgi:hypothetical protein
MPITESAQSAKNAPISKKSFCENIRFSHYELAGDLRPYRGPPPKAATEDSLRFVASHPSTIKLWMDVAQRRPCLKSQTWGTHSFGW